MFWVLQVGFHRWKSSTWNPIPTVLDPANNYETLKRFIIFGETWLYTHDHSLALTLSLFPSFSFSVFFFFYLSLFLRFCLSVFLSFPLFFYFLLSLFLSFSLSIFLLPSFSLSLMLSITSCLYVPSLDNLFIFVFLSYFAFHIHQITYVTFSLFSLICSIDLFSQRFQILSTVSLPSSCFLSYHCYLSLSDVYHQLHSNTISAFSHRTNLSIFFLTGFQHNFHEFHHDNKTSFHRHRHRRRVVVASSSSLSFGVSRTFYCFQRWREKPSLSSPDKKLFPRSLVVSRWRSMNHQLQPSPFEVMLVNGCTSSILFLLADICCPLY